MGKLAAALIIMGLISGCANHAVWRTPYQYDEFTANHQNGRITPRGLERQQASIGYAPRPAFSYLTANIVKTDDPKLLHFLPWIKGTGKAYSKDGASKVYYNPSERIFIVEKKGKMSRYRVSENAGLAPNAVYYLERLNNDQQMWDRCQSLLWGFVGKKEEDKKKREQELRAPMAEDMPSCGDVAGDIALFSTAYAYALSLSDEDWDYTRQNPNPGGFLLFIKRAGESLTLIQ